MDTDPIKGPTLPIRAHGKWLGLWMFDKQYAFVHRNNIGALVPILHTNGDVAGTTVLIGTRHIEVEHSPGAILALLIAEESA